jgi:phosphoribosylformylglycinamidine synthase
MKVETHNHPTAISPFPGASTGAGGEIRDEGATGRGSRPKAGLTGFTVSNLRGRARESPGNGPPGGKPEHIASPLQIMTEGRWAAPRSTTSSAGPTWRATSANTSRPWRACAAGYHKPIMIAGGLGSIDAGRRTRSNSPPARCWCSWAAPACASAWAAAPPVDGHRRQRGRAGLRLGAARQPRDRAPRAGGHQPLLGAGRGNPILAIHDVGAGGLSNAFPELTNDAGAARASTCAPCRWKSPAWRPRKSGATRARSATCWPSRPSRCRCSSAVRARALPVRRGRRGHRRARSWCWKTAQGGRRVIDMPMDVLLGKPPKMHRDVQRVPRQGRRWT